jgi:hypothetical protein
MFVFGLTPIKKDEIKVNFALCRNQNQCISVKVVGINRESGLESARHVVSGIPLLKK